VSPRATLGPRSLFSIVQEARARSGDRQPIVVDGASGLVPLLARELRAGGDAAAVREGGSPHGAAALVWIGNPDEAKLRAASLARVPIIGLTEGESLPYVLDTNIVSVAAGEPLPVERVARALARRLGHTGTGLASRLPVLREPVVDELIRAVSRRNAMIAAAIWIPGADMPVLTLNQARLALRIALAHGEEIDRSRLPELAGVVGAGFGFRAIARQLLTVVPVAGWTARGAVAYAGTKAIGEAARRRFAGS
jgi:uncharacterized protein (DUF697 family)